MLLNNQKIVLVRTGTEESKVANELRRNGAEVFEFPKWKKVILPVGEAAVKRLDSFDKILFTSSEAVTEFFNIVIENSIELNGHFFGLSLKTLRVLKNYEQEGLLAEKMSAAGKLLIVGDQQIGAEKEQSILKYGEHELLITSKKYINQISSKIIAEEIMEKLPEVLFFPSGKSVHIFAQEAVSYEIDFIAKCSRIVCMGNNSTEAAKQCGFSPNEMPAVPTIDSLLACLSSR
ncbi:hypothetical protein ABET51_05855 [Metabacillus fastidiosus]|uniref:hypothetical protein n=1 Tax=Metabacillus fastidiosus TaxID=1458 RepID=UPI003D28C5B5